MCRRTSASMFSCRCTTAPRRCRRGHGFCLGRQPAAAAQVLSRSEFWADVRRHQVTVCQTWARFCRFLLTRAAPARGHTLTPCARWWVLARRLRSGVNGPRALATSPRSTEGWGATESNTNTINLDNCDRLLRPRAVLEKPTCAWCATTSTPTPTRAMKTAFCSRAEVGETGEAIGTTSLTSPRSMGGRFEGYTSPEATERKSCATCSARAMPGGRRATCCAWMPTAIAGLWTASATPSAGTAKTLSDHRGGRRAGDSPGPGRCHHRLWREGARRRRPRGHGRRWCCNRARRLIRRRSGPLLWSACRATPHRCTCACPHHRHDRQLQTAQGRFAAPGRPHGAGRRPAVRAR